MKKWVKRTGLAGLILLVVLLLIAVNQIRSIGPAATGYSAKMVCSAIFITGQTLSEALADFPDNPIKGLLRIHVDYDQQSVAASILGLSERRAVYRDGYGATLVPPQANLAPLPPLKAFPSGDTSQPEQFWPKGETVNLDELPANINREKLQTALDRAFSEPDPELRRRTRAVVIVYNDRIVAERYAPGFTKDTPLLEWSMSKSVTNALVGILVKRGKLFLDMIAPVPEWSETQDARHKITIDQLLRMSSGLEFEEEYGDLTSDAVQMLYVQRDMAAFAARKPLIHPPDSIWYYSSGTANILSRIVSHAIGSDEDYVNFPRQYLFGPLGMSSVVFEPDGSGTFIGSSLLYASARDWARFGLLYLNDGVWKGKRILPEGWVTYSTTPTPNAPLGQYGALFWLNAGERNNPSNKRWPTLPQDIFYCDGHDGQHVVIVPSYDLIIVRLGLSQKAGAWSLGDFLADVLAAFPETQ